MAAAQLQQNTRYIHVTSQCVCVWRERKWGELCLQTLFFFFFLSRDTALLEWITKPDKSAWSAAQQHLEGVKGCGRAMREPLGVWARQQHFSVTAVKMENESTEGVVSQHAQAHWARPVFGGSAAALKLLVLTAGACVFVMDWLLIPWVWFTQGFQILMLSVHCVYKDCNVPGNTQQTHFKV